MVQDTLWRCSVVHITYLSWHTKLMVSFLADRTVLVLRKLRLVANCCWFSCALWKARYRAVGLIAKACPVLQVANRRALGLSNRRLDTFTHSCFRIIKPEERAMKVVFLHPDLGIGGAERLIVDAAVALSHHGHQVKLVTNHYSSDHCFSETTSLDIETHFSWRRDIFGRMMALCAYVKMILAAIYVCLFCEADLFIVDQVSACIPILKWFSSARVLFYCHFPDQLLTRRDSFMKSIYRAFFDWLEEWSTAKADVICVNSRFTASVVKNTFRRLKDRHLTILYPCLNTQTFDESRPVNLEFLNGNAKSVYLSVNRYERKKNVGLALEAYALLKSRLSEEKFASTFMVIAGGYDKKNIENIEHYEELKQKAAELSIPDNQIVFLKSPSDAIKIELLRRASMVLYTPTNEHFGIVPVEAMYMKTCVVALNSGGPTESIEDGVTGFLCEETAESFADAMEKCVTSPKEIEMMGIAGEARARDIFGIDVFGEKLNNIVLLE
ncbi:hypothetical protein L596_006535 [Steinernema carpocapsae]|uniref:Alpha-1,3/1,6-mannosyltransferase ALG2 n=1 Tax=Steinernema carpocapsae TaxID=34508 RepID=A0A4V6I915_STECR|nr:hypothetical protein L596_006535 [Steinernema carpocapsae]